MRLKTELVLEQARVKRIVIELTKDDPKVTIEVRAGLTREVAESFGCRELIYAGDAPRSGVDKMALEGEEVDCEVHFQHDNMAFTAVANTIGHYTAKMEGDGPKLLFRIKLTGFTGTAADLADRVKIDPLQITLKPAQQDLGLKPGQIVEAGESASEDSPSELLVDGATMAPAAVMGGTHQRGRKKNRPDEQPAPPVLEPEADEDLSFMEAPVVQ